MQQHHTPGPWRLYICDDGGEWTGWPISITAANDEDKTVVRTGGQWPYKWDVATSQREALANAHLITAAPDMLAVLLAFVDDDGRTTTDMLQAAAKAAIAKALGEKNV